MAEEPKPARTRRSLLAAGLGAVAAAVAGAVGRPDPIRAASGDPLVLGMANSSGTSQTVLTNAGTGAAFTLKTTNTAAGATGIFGWSSSAAAGATRGVYGRADGPNSYALEGRHLGAFGAGAAVHAVGGNNMAIDATTSANGLDYPTIKATNDAPTDGVGLYAYTTGDNTYAVRAVANGSGPGVIGISGFSAGQSGTGVTGQSTGAGGDSVGVAGASANGWGGSFLGNQGLYAEATSSGWAGQFVGDVQVAGHQEFITGTDPASTTGAKLYVRDNGGKLELCVKFPTGAVQVIATEP